MLIIKLITVFLQIIILVETNLKKKSVPPKKHFVAHIFATVWAIYWQDIDHTAHISAVYGQYVAPGPKPNIGLTVSHIMSTFVPYFFSTRQVKCVLYALRAKNSLRILRSSWRKLVYASRE